MYPSKRQMWMKTRFYTESKQLLERFEQTKYAGRIRILNVMSMLYFLRKMFIQ